MCISAIVVHGCNCSVRLCPRQGHARGKAGDTAAPKRSRMPTNFALDVTASEADQDIAREFAIHAEFTTLPKRGGNCTTPSWYRSNLCFHEIPASTVALGFRPCSARKQCDSY